jgi:hypothetical protein
MGYILNPIAVDLKKVAGVIGSKNKKLLGTLVKQFGGSFEEIDEMAADFTDEEDGEGATTVRDALTQMVMGQEYNDELGFVYGYALEFICSHFGSLLSNENWSAMPSPSKWAQKADKALESVGVDEKTLRLSQLMYRGSPIPLPLIEDFPGIGYMTHKEIVAAVEAFSEDKLDAVKDEAVREALSEVRGWLWSCEDSGEDLICFLA